MKKKILGMSAAILLCCVACQGESSQVKYTVNGTAPAAAKTVYIVDQLTGNKIDSVAVTNGTFTFTGTADRDALLSVSSDDSKWSIPFFNDGTAVSVNLADSTLKGSPLNECLCQYDLISGRMINGLNAIYMEAVTAPEDKQDSIAKVYQQKVEVVLDYFKTIFEKESDNIIPAAFIATYASSQDTDGLERIFDAKHAYMNHPVAKQVKEQFDKVMEAEKAAKAEADKLLGKPFIDFEEPDTNGKMRKLSEFVGNGKWLFVDFWASWCGPCRAEMPNVVSAYEKYHQKGFDIVGVSFDNSKEAWVKAIKDLNMPWNHISDLKGWENAASGLYNINSIPASLLIDPQGNIAARNLRGEELQRKLAEIFGE